MLIKTLLNKVERFKSFVYGSIWVQLVDGVEALVIDIEPRRYSRPICPECSKKRNIYDRQPQRLFEYLPVWTVPEGAAKDQAPLPLLGSIIR